MAFDITPENIKDKTAFCPSCKQDTIFIYSQECFQQVKVQIYSCEECGQNVKEDYFGNRELIEKALDLNSKA